MKTLLISSQYPLPEIGGNRIRTMNFARYFKKFGDVDLAWYQDTPQERHASAVFSQEFPIVYKACSKKQNRLQGLYEQISHAKPWIVCSYSDETVQELQGLIEQGDYDQIVCRYAVSAYPLLSLSEKNRKKVIVDIDDIMTPDLYQAVYGILPGLRRIRSLLDMKLYKTYQTNCARIGKALVCSDDDRQLLLQRAPAAHVHVVPNVSPQLHLPDSYRFDGFKNMDTLLFVGNLAYPPNVSGLQWFVRDIFSRLATEYTGIRLLVVGKDPDSRVRAICNGHAQVELIENPADIIPFYEQCGVVVVPLLSGGGTRIKILEAGRARRPVISTETGAYGLSLQDRRTFLAMDGYTSFKDSYDWLKNPGHYSSLVDSMQQYVEKNFTVKNFEQALDRVTSLTGILGTTVPVHCQPGLVSVIVPVYNRADLVGATLESILAQTYRNIEVIAVNDGSTDTSLEVLKAYANKFPDKVTVIDQQNSGQVRARNTGIYHAQGEFIAFLDSDDTWAREKLELQIPLFNLETGLVYSGINEVDLDNTIIRTVPCEIGMRGNIYRKLLIKNRMTGGSVVVSRTALESVGVFDESLQAAENWDLWIRIARNYKVNYVNKPLVNYLKHSGNISSNHQLMSLASQTLLGKHLPPSAKKGELRQTYALAYAHFHYNQAVMFFGAGEYQQARTEFLRCWRYKPLYRDSGVRMLRSLMGRGINRLLSDSKNKMTLLFMKGRHDPASC